MDQPRRPDCLFSLQRLYLFLLNVTGIRNLTIAGAGPLGSIVAEYGEEDSDPEEDPTTAQR